MAQWAVVAEVYDGIGYSTAVRQVCVLAEVEGTREDALAELLRQSHADHPWFVHPRNRGVYRDRDTYLITARKRDPAWWSEGNPPTTPLGMLKVWEQVWEGQ